MKLALLGVALALMLASAVLASSVEFDEEYSPLYAAARDPEVDPEVRSFLKHSALRSEREELAQLEAGQLSFDEQGNDVMLETSPLQSTQFSADVEKSLKAKIAERWKAEGYYQNPEATFQPTEDEAGSFLELHAERSEGNDHAEAVAEDAAEAEDVAQAEEAQEANPDDIEFVESTTHVFLDEPLSAEEAARGDVAAVEVVSTSQSQAEAQATQGSEDFVASSINFLETSERFSPEAVKEHKNEQIGKMRHLRTRAKRVMNRRGQAGNNLDNPREGEALDSYGPYDERRSTEEARVFSEDTDKAMDAERKQRLGSVRPIGLSRAPFCATFPWCHQTPPPPDMAPLPRHEDPARARAENALLDPLKALPIKLRDLKRDPHRFGLVFQAIYNHNKHNEKLANAHGVPAEE